MKRTRKRIISILAAAALSVSSLPQSTPLLLRPAITASAAETSGTCGENCKWDLKDGVLTISGTGEMTNYTLEDRPFSGLSFTKAVISDGVTNIGDYTFMRCFGVESITIADSVKRLGNQAFYQCTALTDITIPSSVTDIGLDVFNETPWLEARQNENPLVIVNSILVDGRTCTGEVTIPEGITRIGEYAFYLCKTMTDIQIPASVTSIAGGAFSGCWELKSVAIPNGVTAIEDAAFARCSALTSVRIPNSVTSIGGSAFLSCYALENIRIPGSVTSINNTAFEDCKKLTIQGYTGTIAETYSNEHSIPFESLGGAPAESVYQGLKYMAKDGEVMITGFTDDLPAVLEIPAEIDGMPVTGFAQFALAQCGKLKEVTLPDTVTAFGMQTFWGCENLEKVTLPSTLKGLYEASFAQCTALKSVTIPEGCETIGNLVFAGCTSLSEVSIPESVVNFYEPAFTDTPWLAAKQAENPLVAVNGILIDATAASGEVTVPDGVKVINSYAFMDCDAITKITLPESAAKIDGISSAALTDVTILNPECEIKDAEDTITNGYDSDADKMNYKGTIHGYDGSTAQAYAEKYGYTFESLGDATEDPVNDWAEKSVISKNTEEAELVVRVGDIDACNDENAVADHGYDPFTAKSQYAHGYPWQKDETDPAGTDRIFVGSKWNGNATDGYASNYAEYKNGNDKENAFGEGALSFTLEYDASEIDIENVILQLCIDDFQSLSWESNFTVTLNGKDAPFIAELLNHTDQTGPTAYVVSAMIPSGFFEDIASGKLTVVIDETTGVGDGYAIDFARLLINYDEQIFTGTFSGKTEPDATVRLLGTSTIMTASPDGAFTFNAIPGINAVRASKNGFVEKYDSGIVLSTGTEWKPVLSLEEGQGNPDIDFSKFAETGKPLKGDYNGDGEITVADAVLLARFLVEDTELTAEQIAEILNHEPDFNDDGLLTIMDVTALLKKLTQALKPEVTIKETKAPDVLSNDARFEAVGKWYEVNSESYDGLPLSGDVLFTAPIPGEVNPEDLGSYVFVYYDEKKDEYRYLFPDSCDLTAGTMTIDLPHFSFWGPAKLTKEEQIEAFLNSYSTKLAVESGNSKKSASELEPYVRAKAEAMGLTKQATEDLIQSSLNFLGGRFTGKNKAFIESGTKYTTTLTRGFYDKDGEAALNGLDDAINDALMNSWDELQFSDRLDKVLGSEFAGSTTAKLLSSTNGIARMAGYMAEGDMEDAMKELGSVMQGAHPAVELGTKAIAYLGAKVNEEFTNWKSNQIEELYRIYKNGLEDIWGNEVIPCNRDSFLTYLNTSSGFTMAKGVARFYNLDKVGEICKQYNWSYSSYEELPPRFLEVFQQRAEDGLMKYFELRLQQEKTAEEIKKTERACIETMMSRYGALDSGSYSKFFGEASPDDFNLTARLERLVNVRSFVSQYVDEDKLAEVAKIDNSYNYGDILNWWVDLASNHDKPVAIQKFREELREHGFLKTYADEPIETPSLQIQFDYVEGWATSNTKSETKGLINDAKFGGFYWTSRDNKEIVRMTSKPVFEMFKDGSFRLQIARHSGKDNIYNSDDEKIGEYTWSNNGFILYGNVRESIDGLDEWEAEINDCSVPFFEFEEANLFGNYNRWYFKDSFRSGTLRYEKYESYPELYVDIITADGEIHIECTWRATFHW